MRSVPNPSGRCMCGCGQQTRRSPQTHTATDYLKGEHYRYVLGHVQRGGLPSSPKRYVTRMDRTSVHASSSGCVYEHVQVASKALGKPLPRGAVVHHVDGNRHNNAPSNLVICQDIAYHSLLHVRQRVIEAGGDPNTQRVCSRCKAVLSFDSFWQRSANGSGRQSACRACMNEYRRQLKARRAA